MVNLRWSRILAGSGSVMGDEYPRAGKSHERRNEGEAVQRGWDRSNCDNGAHSLVRVMFYPSNNKFTMISQIMR